MEEHEVIILGGGIGGISSAIYAKRAGLSPVIIEKNILGGQLSFIDRIDNYPGIKLGTKGYELMKELEETVKELSIPLINEDIIKVEIGEEGVLFSSLDKTYKSRATILATGATFKKLGVPGEEDFFGRGVSRCAVCDGYFFKDKIVAVVGGGNTAVGEALYLSSLCKKVYLIHRRDKLRAVEYLQKEIENKSNIEVIWNSVVERIEGKEFVESIVLKDIKKEEVSQLPVSGIFIAIGFKPNTGVVRGLVDMDERGFILTDEEMRTSKEFIYACGDCRKRPLRQLITAASEGAIAALTTYRDLKDRYISY